MVVFYEEERKLHLMLAHATLPFWKTFLEILWGNKLLSVGLKLQIPFVKRHHSKSVVYLRNGSIGNLRKQRCLLFRSREGVVLLQLEPPCSSDEDPEKRLESLSVSRSAFLPKG